MWKVAILKQKTMLGKFSYLSFKDSENVAENYEKRNKDLDTFINDVAEGKTPGSLDFRAVK